MSDRELCRWCETEERVATNEGYKCAGCGRVEGDCRCSKLNSPERIDERLQDGIDHEERFGITDELLDQEFEDRINGGLDIDG